MLQKYNNIFLVLLCVLHIKSVYSVEAWRKQLDLVEITRHWASVLSEELIKLNRYARKYDAEKSFETSEDVQKMSGEKLRDNIKEDIIRTMNHTENAVKRISKHAEELSMYRKPAIFGNATYNYYNTDEITNDENFSDDSAIIEEVRNQWNCDRPGHLPEFQCLADPSDRLKREYDSFNYQQLPENKMFERRSARNKPACRNVSYIERDKHFFDVMRFEQQPRFDVPVNLNYSIIKVMNNIDNRDFDVINGIRFTEALDQTFKCNFEQLNSGGPKTSFQYFASRTGFIRYYPATEWSKEDYDMTYDFRIRSWYTEALTSPKDIVILVDNSGSIKGNRRLISKVIVNNILDTLTDNDYVNVYTYSNYSSPVVNCFDGTMVQANEENLRLFREQFDDHDDKFASDIAVGLRVAFPLLIKHRNTRRRGIICNQAIMLITEGLDYEYDADIFKKYNSQEGKNYYGPIRIFTYLLGTEPNDGRRMEWIACANMGFYVNISIPEEVQEKVFKYLDVMSRSVNLQHTDAQLTKKGVFTPEVAWSPQYIHLADRRVSNWLWKKSEGIRQREIFIQLGKDQMKSSGYSVEPNGRHFTNSEFHPNKQYEIPRKYIFLTTASVPVYDKRHAQMSLLGVAAIDLPIEYIKQKTNPYKIGVNGYAFILTNNGYVLSHPHHRIVFGNNILKPTYNRVDLTEVEITTKTMDSRKFDSSIIALRDNMVMQRGPGSGKLKVKTPLEDMKRVIINVQVYYWDAIGPFTLAIVLPDKYGHLKINHPVKATFEELLRNLSFSGNWTIHPEWQYCTHPKMYTLIQFLNAMRTKFVEQYCKTELTYLLLKDLYSTKWFVEEFSFSPSRISTGNIISIFISTHSGLTRWKQLDLFQNWTILSLGETSIDQVWYRRAVDMNYHFDADMFVYSLAFQENSKNDVYNNSVVTVTRAIFQRGRSGDTPVAVVGYQLKFLFLMGLFKEITKSHCRSAKNCKLSCESDDYNCFVIDNDGYIILHYNTTLIGRSLANVDQIFVDHLVRDKILDSIKMFDYQGTCFPPEPEPEDSFYGPGKDVDPNTKCATEIKCKTIAFLSQSIKKTIPTPCDMEHRMYHILQHFGTNIDKEKPSSFCSCPYVASRINGTNLLFLLQRGRCCHFNETLRSESVVNQYPQEINYNTMSMACYIGTQNNYTIRSYKTCIRNNEVEYELNNNSSYCKIL